MENFEELAQEAVKTDRIDQVEPSQAWPRTASEWLDALDEFFASTPDRSFVSTSEQSRLWDVLSALRGPDQPKLNDLKTIVTTTIRAAAFPKTQQAGYNGDSSDWAHVGDLSAAFAVRKGGFMYAEIVEPSHDVAMEALNKANLVKFNYSESSHFHRHAMEALNGLQAMHRLK